MVVVEMLLEKPPAAWSALDPVGVSFRLINAFKIPKILPRTKAQFIRKFPK
jgi:hypothetical protein